MLSLHRKKRASQCKSLPYAQEAVNDAKRTKKP